LKKTKRKICVITSSRADYSHLYPLMLGLKKSKLLTLQIIATGMHLLKNYGYTYKDISNDGFTINQKVNTNQKNTSSTSIIKSMSVELTGIEKALKRLKPDLIVILGDRYDIFPAAIVAHIKQIPICHIHGGEVTSGSIDDSVRHCLTKISHIHLVASEIFKKRVIQLGEDKNNVFNVGSLGIHSILSLPKLAKVNVYKYFNIKFNKDYLVISIHPETINEKNLLMIKNLLEVLKNDNNYNYIFTSPNSDTGANLIDQEIRKFVKKNKHTSLYIKSAGRTMFINLLRFSKGIIGNSSSGLIEAPALNIPSINIGNRQKGRPLSSTVDDISYSKKEIDYAIKKLKLYKKQNSQEIHYQNKKPINKILKIFNNFNSKKILNKKFVDNFISL
tara:strand:- start:469 stop:1635 length:1167 start_codon:yes stop_codon:yes gene_type:complete